MICHTNGNHSLTHKNDEQTNIMAQTKANQDPLALKLMRTAFKYLTPLLPGTMSRYAYNLWLTPPRMNPPERELRYIESAKQSTISVEGQNIKLWHWGEGPTVLFIHGWGGRGTQISCFVDDLVKAGFQVVGVDLPAHGQSDGKQTNALIMAKALKAVINQIDNLHSIITHSFGAVILGLDYDANLSTKNIVMICPPATMNTAFNQFSSMLQLPQTIIDYIIKTMKQNFGNDILDRVSLSKNANQMIQPTLVIHDVQDDVVPIADGKIIASILKQGSFYETNGLGHRKILYDQGIVTRTVQFITTAK